MPAKNMSLSGVWTPENIIYFYTSSSGGALNISTSPLIMGPSSFNLISSTIYLPISNKIHRRLALNVVFCVKKYMSSSVLKSIYITNSDYKLWLCVSTQSNVENVVFLLCFIRRSISNSHTKALEKLYFVG